MGFISDEMVLTACDQISPRDWQACVNGRHYRPCLNYSDLNVCNWLVPIKSNNVYCDSCQLTETIPDLSQPENLEYWYRMEKAKRHLLYTLKKLGLPVWRVGPEHPPLRFRFLQDVTEDEYGQELTVKSTVVTGHNEGVITLNLKEAEDASRIIMREKMNERYRTLVGHFRHESGHFYWDVLIRNSDVIEEFRALFGDERMDYRQALHNFYQFGPAVNWQENYISAYASMHPWEDWAESWTHYLHIIDTLETANEYWLSIRDNRLQDPVQAGAKSESSSTFEKMFEDWLRLTTVLNALNRSMGQDDAYPFTIPLSAKTKLQFIHRLIHSHG